MFLKKTVVFMSKGFGVGKLFGCRNIHHPVEVVTQKVKLPVLVVYVVPGKLVGLTIVSGQVLTKLCYLGVVDFRKFLFRKIRRFLFLFL